MLNKTVETIAHREIGMYSQQFSSNLLLNINYNAMKLYPVIIIMAALFVFSGCSKQNTDNISEFTVPNLTPSGDENYLNNGSDYIYDQDKLRTYNLLLPKSSLIELDEDPTAEEYVEGALVFEGDTISPVGIRYKGSIGAWVGCVSGKDVFNPSGIKTCTKLSMKVKINWKGRDEKFFKLKKLQFHSMNSDPSQMHERLGYWLFREMGVPAPRSVHAKLNINGQYVGVFALTEQIDNRFIKENYDDDKGNLYKEIWPLNPGGVPYSDQEYKDALKTNEDDNPSIDLIKNLGQGIADAGLSSAKDVVEQFLDIDEIMSYSAVDRTIRHDDGPFHWYCSDNECSNHNYYWYEEPNEEKLHLIAWDLDNAFANIINNANPITPIADEWGETSNNCAPFQHLLAVQWSASCDKLTATWASYSDKYEEKKLQLINGPMSEASVNQMLDAWQNQIKDATREASDLNDDAISVKEWELKIIQLKEQLEYARNN